MAISKETIRELAESVIEKEAQAVKELKPFVDSRFLEVLDIIFNSKGRLIITGIGKSAIIGNKIVATMNSTGTPAIFMHAADAIHGDLGIIQPDDVVFFQTKSGRKGLLKVISISSPTGDLMVSLKVQKK